MQKYEHPYVTVDAAIFGFDYSALKVLLIKRGLDPFKGQWALPGGFVRKGESVNQAVLREIQEEAGIKNELYLEQLYTFGQPDRDPRGWIISVSYFALVNLHNYDIKAATDATDVGWFEVSNLPKLAFDHNQIIEKAIERLRGKITYQPIGFALLPTTFTLSALQGLYESILGKSLDKRNFRKKVLSLGLLQPQGPTAEKTAHRRPQLYSFNQARYSELVNKGFHFEV